MGQLFEQCCGATLVKVAFSGQPEETQGLIGKVPEQYCSKKVAHCSEKLLKKLCASSPLVMERPTTK